MDILTQPVLVLNGSYFPISVRSVKDAICLVLLDKAEIIKAFDGMYLRSEKLKLPVPNIIVISGYYKVPQKKLRPTRQNIFVRDNNTCVYCRKQFPAAKLTLDHVVPRSRWNEISKKQNLNYEFQSWENVVTACKSCNNKKGSKLLSEIKWKIPEVQKKNSRIFMGLNISETISQKFGWNDYLYY